MSKSSKNYELYPNILFPPKMVLVNNEEYKLYMARFNSLYSIYDYLKSNPKTNVAVFSRLSSESSDEEFAGKPLNEAIDDLIKNGDYNYKNFLKLQKELINARMAVVNKYRTIQTVSGGHLNNFAYCVGAPMCYEIEEKISENKFIKAHVALSYSHYITKEQVLNRAIIIANIVKALENSGYSVDLNTFELSIVYDELINIVVQIKRYNAKINLNNLYKTLCKVEFLRRILFRVLETMDVENDWGYGYGRTCEEDMARQVLNIDSKEIYFGPPDSMNISGNSLENDFMSAIDTLGLSDKLDIEKVKKEFEEENKILNLK